MHPGLCLRGGARRGPRGGASSSASLAYEPPAARRVSRFPLTPVSCAGRLPRLGHYAELGAPLRDRGAEGVGAAAGAPGDRKGGRSRTVAGAALLLVAAPFTRCGCRRRGIFTRASLQLHGRSRARGVEGEGLARALRGLFLGPRRLVTALLLKVAKPHDWHRSSAGRECKSLRLPFRCHGLRLPRAWARSQHLWDANSLQVTRPVQLQAARGGTTPPKGPTDSAERQFASTLLH